MQYLSSANNANPQSVASRRRTLAAAIVATLAAAAFVPVARGDETPPASPRQSPAPRTNTASTVGAWAVEQEAVLSEHVDRFLKRLNLAALEGPTTRPAGGGPATRPSQDMVSLPGVPQWTSLPPRTPVVTPMFAPTSTVVAPTPAPLNDSFDWTALGNDDLFAAPRTSSPLNSISFPWPQMSGLTSGHVATTTTTTSARPAMVAEDEFEDGKILVTVHDSRIIKTSRPFHRVSVASPDVADVTPLSPDTLLINTKAPGNTQIMLWDEDEETQTLLVQSQADLREVQEKLNGLMGNNNIEAIDLKGRIALQGRVAGVEQAQKAVEIAGAYGEVVDFLTITGNQQVMLEIRFAEVSRSASKQLGVNFAFADGTSVGASTIGGQNPIFPGTGETGVAANSSGAYNVPGSGLGAAVSVFGGGEIGETAFNFFISALRENNLLRVLAEPNLTVISGEEAEFIAGGEFPIPVPNEEGIGIEYREFGIKLRYLPVVLGDGRIRLRVEPEVSDLDFTAAVSIGGTRVPGLRKRSLSTTVELVEGQTFALAGLLDSSVVANKQATPLLGDVPVLGALFRSTRYQRRETELVVLVTPRLVSPLNPDEVGPLPGENWKHPNEIELFLLGQMGGEAAVDKPHQGDIGGADNAATKRDTGPRLEASYTYLPPEPAAGK